MRKPKNRNGIGCMSIASSSAVTNAMISSKSSFRRSQSGSARSKQSAHIPPPSRPPRKKRSASNSLSGESDIRNLGSLSSGKGIHPDFDTSSDERDKNARPKKAPPLPLNPPNLSKLITKELKDYHKIFELNFHRSSSRYKIEKRRRTFGKVKIIRRSKI